MTQYYFCIFVNRHSKTFASGVSRYTQGRYGVIVRRIPRNAPQDWGMGPPQNHTWTDDKSREHVMWGAYSYTSFWDSPKWKHYAFAVGKNPEDCQRAAAGHFQFQVGPWSECENARSLEASVRYRYHGGSE